MDRTSRPMSVSGRPPLHPGSFHVPAKSYAGAAGSTFSSAAPVEEITRFRVRSRSRTKRTPQVELKNSMTGNNSTVGAEAASVIASDIKAAAVGQRIPHDSKCGTRHRKHNSHRSDGMAMAEETGAQNGYMYAPPPTSPYMWPGTNMLQFGIVCNDPPTTYPTLYTPYGAANSYPATAPHPSASYSQAAIQTPAAAIPTQTASPASPASLYAPPSSHSVPSLYPPPIYDNSHNSTPAPLYQEATIGIPLNCPNCHCVWLLRAIQVNNPVVVAYPQAIDPIPPTVSMPMQNFTPSPASSSFSGGTIAPTAPLKTIISTEGAASQISASFSGGTIAPTAPLKTIISTEGAASQISAPLIVSGSAKQGTVSTEKSTAKTVAIATTAPILPAPSLPIPTPSAPVPPPSAPVLPPTVPIPSPFELAQVATSKSIAVPATRITSNAISIGAGGSRTDRDPLPVQPCASPAVPETTPTKPAQNLPEQQTAKSEKIRSVVPLLPQIGSRGKKAVASPQADPLSMPSKASVKIVDAEVVRTVLEPNKSVSVGISLIAKSEGIGSVAGASCSSVTTSQTAAPLEGVTAIALKSPADIAARTSRRTAKRLARRRRKAAGSIASEDCDLTVDPLSAEIPIVMLIQRDKIGESTSRKDEAAGPSAEVVTLDAKAPPSEKTSELQTLGTNVEKKQSPTSNRKRYKPRKITRQIAPVSPIIPAQLPSGLHFPHCCVPMNWSTRFNGPIRPERYLFLSIQMLLHLYHSHHPLLRRPQIQL